jgi:hypothetical protein
MVVAFAEVTVALPLLNLTLLSPIAAWKFVPVIVTASPGAPAVGEKLVMVGGDVVPMLKTPSLVSDPPGLVTEINPVVAPSGTVTMRRVAVAEVTFALVPLN